MSGDFFVDSIFRLYAIPKVCYIYVNFTERMVSTWTIDEENAADKDWIPG